MSGRRLRDTDADRLVADILRRFALQPTPSTQWQRRLTDLGWVLQSDYAEAVRSSARAGSLPLRELAGRARSVLPEFNRLPLGLAETVARVAGTSRDAAVRVHMSPFGEAGNPLRGFYHRDPDSRRLIWLNVQHVPTAIAATLGHELGHFFWEDLHSDSPPGARPFYNAEFAAHLADPRELFADAFATLAAYPKDSARRLFSRRGWPRSWAALRQREAETITDVHAYLQRNYGADLGPGGGLPSLRRFRYIVSMIHFAKVRAAILHVEDL